MHIEEVILEGFKSYATRTVISKWDPQFNAITGLNGSGKSNILDAICFVLGIDNLRQVRATTLQDLVYKRGQSGVTKASVSVVFNNSDPSQCPVGFADQPQITVTRQIVVGGKNKYLINGHNTPQKVVETMFQSVQLNVNNPHFLIMQGQITKVLNMKPPEVLAMVEETAGTRMFEDRKSKAETVMERKEKKVEEIQGLLDDIIEPRLSTLRMERNDFVEFKRVEAEMEQAERYVTASDYFANAQHLEKVSAELMQRTENMAEMQQEHQASTLELQELNAKLEGLVRKRQKEAHNSAILKQLEAQSREATMSAVRVEADLNLQRKRFEEEQAKAAQIKKNIKALKKGIAEQEEQMLVTKQHYDTAKDTHDRVQSKTLQDEELLQSLTTGVSVNGSDTGYTKLLNDLNQQKSASSSTVQRAQLQLAELASELNALEPKAAEARKKLSKETDAISELRKGITVLEAKMADSSHDANAEAALTQEKRQLDTRIRKNEETLEELKAQVNQCNLNFSMNGVKGVVANLIDIPQEHSKYINALEVTAGGKLYNIVVEDEKVASALLESGKLTRRVTIIPLNKIVSHGIHADKLNLAHQIGGTNAVHTALSLVGYQGEVEAAMRFVFGGTLICDEKDAASAITFDKRIHVRTVTLEGDVYEPSGVLTGGSNTRNVNLLSKLAAYKAAKLELDQVRGRWQEVNKQLEALFEQRAATHADKQRLNLMQQDLQSRQRQFELNPMGKTLNRIDTIKNEVVRLEDLVKEQSAQKTLMEKQIAEVERDMGDFSGDREGKLKALQKSVNLGKASLEKELVKLRKAQQALESAGTALETQKSALQKLELEASACHAEAESVLAEVEILDRQLSDAALKAKDLCERLDTEMRFIKQYDQELVALEEKKSQLQGELDHYQVRQRRVSEEVARCQAEVDKCGEELRGALRKHAWLNDIIPQLGQPNGPFHFTQHSVSEARRRLKQFQEQHRKLKSSINVNVMEMIDRVEAKEATLKQMLGTVKRDKKKIEDTIEKLDGYKMEALTRTWTKVNEDFGSIFAELLPGSFCKLDVLEGKSITEGLEIKVSLGSVWKQSLAELSGGQRSVVALSLILALLQFKPAPMYILDEVDAALDLSHTQNIGNLLRTRFRGSQFIIVSLKEGMFNNANVLFRTRFNDGVSSVERFEHGTEVAREDRAARKKVKPVVSGKLVTA